MGTTPSWDNGGLTAGFGKAVHYTTPHHQGGETDDNTETRRHGERESWRNDLGSYVV